MSKRTVRIMAIICVLSACFALTAPNMYYSLSIGSLRNQAMQLTDSAKEDNEAKTEEMQALSPFRYYQTAYIRQFFHMRDNLMQDMGEHMVELILIAHMTHALDPFHPFQNKKSYRKAKAELNMLRTSHMQLQSLYCVTWQTLTKTEASDEDIAVHQYFGKTDLGLIRKMLEQKVRYAAGYDETFEQTLDREGLAQETASKMRPLVDEHRIRCAAASHQLEKVRIATEMKTGYDTRSMTMLLDSIHEAFIDLDRCRELTDMIAGIYNSRNVTGQKNQQ